MHAGSRTDTRVIVISYALAAGSPTDKKRRELGLRMQLNAPKWTPRQSVTQQGGLITIALNQSGLRFTGLTYLGWGVNDESISPEDS